MKPSNRLHFANIAYPLWLILSITLFIILPGRASYIHWSTLQEAPLLPLKLVRINGWLFFGNILLSAAGIIVFVIANISTGFFVLKLTKFTNQLKESKTDISRLALLGTAFLAGHGILSMVFMTLTLGGWLKPVTTGLILFLGLLSGLIPTTKTILEWPKTWRAGEQFPYKNERLFLGLGITILVLTLFYSSARLSYDSVAVYFSDAKLTALTGEIQYFTKDSFVVSIFQTAIQFSAIIQLFGDQTARLFSWVHGVVIILFSILIAEKAGLSKQARLHLFLLLVTSTAFIDLFGDGKVELASFSPIMAAIYWMLVERQGNAPNRPILFLIGFLLGLSMVARPYNVILAGGFSVLYYLRSAWGLDGTGMQSIKRLSASALWIGLGALGVGLYHLFANWLLLGSPIAMITNAVAIDSSKWQWSIDPQLLLLVRLFYPISVTFLNTPQSLGTISPLLVSFLPALLIKDVRDRVILSRDLLILSIISATVLLSWVFLFFTVLEVRYTFFLWIILFMPIANIMERTMANGTTVIRKISSATTILLLGFIALRVMYIAIDTYSPIDMQGNPQCSDSQFCEHLKSINELAEPGDRVLTISAFRYYLRTDLFACSTTHDEYSSLQLASTRSNIAFWEEVYRQGYKFIAYENDYTTRHVQLSIIPSPENAPDWIELEPIFGMPGDLQVAYKIMYTTTPSETRSICRQNSSGIWEVVPAMR